MQMSVQQLQQKLAKQLAFIYQDVTLTISVDELAQSLTDIMRLPETFEEPKP